MTNIDEKKDDNILAIKLRDRLITLLQGNNISDKDISLEDYQSHPCQLNYLVDWDFRCSQSEECFTGNHHVTPHYGYNVNDYNSESTRRCATARLDKSIRYEHISSIVEQNGKGLFNATASKTVYKLGGHSVHWGCSSCRERGTVYCGACGGSGKQNCSSCGGRGRIYDSHSQTQNLCYGCGGTGKMGCYGCGGDGWNYCKSCDGNGFFTYITTTKSIANPNIKFSFETEILKNELNSFLSLTPVDQLTNITQFSINGYQDINDSNWRVHYTSFSTIIEANFKIKEKIFKIASIGDSVTPFIKPHIFDFLFTKEIEKSKHLASLKKQDYSLSHETFEIFKKSRVLKNALIDYASKYTLKPNDSVKQLNDAIFESCDGFISKESSNLLSSAAIKFTKSISPEYSKEAWFICLFPVLTALFIIGFEVGAYKAGGNKPILYYIYDNINYGLFIAPVLATLIATPFAVLTSSISTSKKRAKIPKEFHTKTKHFKPLVSYIVISVLTIWLGLLIGGIFSGQLK